VHLAATPARCTGVAQLLIVARNLFHKTHDPTPQLSILDSHECSGQRAPIICRKKIGHKVRGLGLALRFSGLLWRALKEKWDWHLQYAGELVQPAGADPVRSFLVFLHLLEREPKSVGDLFLAKSDHIAPHADAASYVFVDWIWPCLLCLHILSLSDHLRWRAGYLRGVPR